jgi:hypothetical protein
MREIPYFQPKYLTKLIIFDEMEGFTGFIPLFLLFDLGYPS